MANPPVYLVRSCHPPVQWDQAEILRDFTCPWQQANLPVTQFRALHSESGLHFRFDAVEPIGPRPQGGSARERVLESSRVELFFSACANLSSYHCFEFSPWGEALIYEARFHRQMNWDWSAQPFQWQAQWLEAGYRVEGLLPWATLQQMGLGRHGPWHVGVFRALFQPTATGDHLRFWMPWRNPQTAKADFHVPSAFGRFELAH